MKLKHDIEHDLEHTIPPEGGPDSQWLFRLMTKKSLSAVKPAPGQCVVDLASGMGQDTLSMADMANLELAGGNRQGARTLRHPLALIVGVEPSDRMIRFGRHALASHSIPHKNSPIFARFVRGLGEEIPLRGASVDAVLCKGALDHFMDPALTLAEIGRVLKPNGRAVIALANYDSLSCRLGRWLDQKQRDGGNGKGEGTGHPYYEPPPDHMTRFTYASIVALAMSPLQVRCIEGLSLLWGFPPWGRLLRRLPPLLQRCLLHTAQAGARLWPAWADVIVLVAEKAPRPTGKTPGPWPLQP